MCIEQNTTRSNVVAAARRSWVIATFITAGTVLLAARPVHAQRFYDMGSLNGDWSIPNDISADGSAVVGWSTSAAPKDHEAVVWTRDEGLVRLPLPPEAQSPEYEAEAISFDGSIIVGHAGVIESPAPTPIIWQNRVPSVLQTPPGYRFGRAFDVSGDGSRIVGKAQNEDPYGGIAVFWINGFPTVFLHGVQFISRDGGTLVHSDWGRYDDIRCTAASVCEPLQRPAGTYTRGIGGVSADGAVIAGNVDPSYLALGGDRPVRWFEGVSTPQELGQFPGATSTSVEGISPDGNTLYGSADNVGAWRWNITEGYRSIENILIQEGLGSQITGWDLGGAYGASDDGKIIFGGGTNPSGHLRGWIADIHHVPPNDTCDHAIFIGQTVLPNLDFEDHVTIGTTEDASPDGASTCGFGGGPDVWYEYSAPIAGFLELSVCGSTLANPVISVHRGCPGGSFNQVFCASDCADASCAANGVCIDRPWVPIEPGQSYFIRVASDKGYSGGLFSLHTRFVPFADDCADAPLLPLNATTPGLTNRATADSVDACDGTSVTAPGVWYRVIGTGATMTASLCGAADYDTKLSLYCGGCSSLNCLAANDNACGSQSEISWCSAPGQQYYILVHGAGSDRGLFDLTVSSSGGTCGFTWNCSPDNDECNAALPLSKGTTLLDNGSATSGNEPTGCGGIAYDLWNTYTPRCTGNITIDTCQSQIGSLSDTVLSVFDSCGTQEWICNDNYADAQVDCGLRSAITVLTTAGHQILIRSGSYPTTAGSGTYPLRITEVPAPVDVQDWTIGAIQFQPVDTNLGFFGGCPPFVTAEGNGYFVSTSGLKDGLAVDMYGNLRGTPTTSGTYDFTVSIADSEITTPGDVATMTMIVSAANSYCADAQPIGEGTFEFGNQGGSTDGPSEQTACAGQNISTIDADLWFLYESSCSGRAKADLCGSSFDTTLAIYPDGNCPSTGSAMACNNDYCGAQSLAEFDVVEGGQYLIRVGGNNGARGNGVLTVTCFDDCNDNGVADYAEIEQETSQDCNHNTVPDECDMAVGDGDDCNGNGQLDECDVGSGVQPGFVTIDFAGDHNYSLQGIDPGFPSGQVTLGGVPFDIATTSPNIWHSVVGTAPNPRSIDISVNIQDATTVYTLINSYWGWPGPTPYAWVEFFGSNGAYFRKDLVGNTDIRDFNQGFFTNGINGTTTINVVSVGQHRLDMQRIDLPRAFQEEALVSIRLTDNGASDFSRVFLAGITARVGGSFDCNANGVPDECDLPGDGNGDGQINVGDWPMLHDCLTGPCIAAPCNPPMYMDLCCAWFDYDTDGDIDDVDVGEFQRRQGWTGTP